MKIIINKEEQELKTVNLDDVDIEKIYAFIFTTSDGYKIIMKIHDHDACDNWVAIGMENSTNGIAITFSSLWECVNQYQKKYTVYEFNNRKDFFDNSHRMESK